MKHANAYEKYDDLSTENMEKAVQVMDACLVENGIDYQKRTQARMLLEKILTEYAGICQDAPFLLLIHRSVKKIRVRLYVKCESFNVMEECEGFFDEISSGDREAPLEWKYSRGRNVLTCTMKTLVPGKEALKYVIHYMDEKKVAFRVGVILRVVNMLILVIEPLLAARIIVAFNASDLDKILMIAIMYALLKAASSLITWIASRNLNKAYAVLRNKLQTDLSNNMMRIKTEHVESHSSGVFIQRIVDEGNNVIVGIDGMLLVFTEVFRLLALLIAFATVSVPMLLYEIVVFLIFFLIVRGQEKKLNEKTRHLRIAKENLNGFVSEMVKACRDIKLLHCEDSFSKKTKECISDYTERTTTLANNTGTYTFVRSQYNAWTDLIYILLLALQMAQFGMTAATALVLYNYNGKANVSAQGVSGATQAYYSLMLAAERIYQLFESKDFEKEVFGEGTLETVQGDIILQDVHFSYSNENSVVVPVLKGTDMHIKPGESVAFVGESGCGKSTILSLITRLYDPEQGDIRLDGVSTASLDRDSLRGNIGMVSQTPYLFNMSIRDNFSIIKEDITDEEMMEACKTACVHDDIMKFAAGYDTVAGESGIMLSGGQRQRIALARCLIRDYPVIVLDEATSALDNETQNKIRAAIENMRGKTVIMVAHRLSTVIGCDRLFYIEDGKVLAAGTHSELIANCDAYRKLYEEEYVAGG